MWCRTCRQDVPGIASEASGAARCVRCGTALAGDPLCATARFDFATNAPDQAAENMCVSALPPMLDELDDELDLGGAMWKVKRLAERSGPRPRVVALDRPHHSLGPHHSRPEQNAAAPAPRHRGRWAWLSWLALLNGLAALICGAVLLGWSVVDNRPELWDLGMPIALGGQAGLLLGLVLQLERIWLGSREAADKLADVEQQLQSVHHATDLLSTTHSAPGTSFYAHLAEGASPNVLLADLKGQLDLVASRMVRR